MRLPALGRYKAFGVEPAVALNAITLVDHIHDIHKNPEKHRRFGGGATRAELRTSRGYPAPLDDRN
jgi:hypothetical protein